MTSDLTRLPVSIGSSITVNCSRVCGPRIYDRWRLYQDVGTYAVINENEQHLKKDFENKTGVSLILNNENCDNGRVNYSLSIANITREVDGLVIECGARNVTDIADSDDFWYAIHKTELAIGKLYLLINIVDSAATLKKKLQLTNHYLLLLLLQRAIPLISLLA